MLVGISAGEHDYIENFISEFSKELKDTIWGVGGNILIDSSIVRGIIYLTTNGGTTWGYQLPDTSINIFRYFNIDFYNAKNGWAYTLNQGVHTVTGGDTTIILKVKNLESRISSTYLLYQNYPDPFNPVTKIKISIRQRANVKLIISDIRGRTIEEKHYREIIPGEY